MANSVYICLRKCLPGISNIYIEREMEKLKNSQQKDLTLELNNASDKSGCWKTKIRLNDKFTNIKKYIY